MRFERADSPVELPELLAGLTSLVPEGKLLHLHRAFITWLAKSVLRKSPLGKELIHCRTIQEAHDMLAEKAPYWEEKLIERGRAEGIDIGRAEGIDIGRSEGIDIGMARGAKSALLLGLEARFGVLPVHAVDAIQSITDVQVLQDFTKAAFTSQSLEQICAMLPDNFAGGH